MSTDKVVVAPSLVYSAWNAVFQWAARNPGYAVGAMLGAMALCVSVLLTVVIVGGRDTVQAVVTQAVKESSATIQTSSADVSAAIQKLNDTVQVLTRELQAHRSEITSLRSGINALSAKVELLEKQIQK